MRFSSAACLLCFGVGLGACATSALDLAPADASRPWRPQTGPDGRIVSGTPDHQAAAGTGFELPENRQLAHLRPAADVDPGKVYDLPALIDLAESRNALTRSAWDAARDAALSVGIARSTYLPRLTVAALGVSQRQDQPTVSVEGYSVSNRTAGQGTVSAASMQWLLFDFGQRAALVDAAEQASIVSNIAFTAAHQQVIYDVALAFYAYAAARDRQAAARTSLANAGLVQSAAEAKLRQQQGTVVETAQARLGKAQAEMEQVTADGAARDKYLALVTAAGLSPATRIDIAQVGGRPIASPATQMTEAAIAEAIGRRPDVLQAYALQQAGMAQIRAAQAEFLPKVFASGNVSYANGQLNLTAVPSVGAQPPLVNLSGSGLGASIILGVTMPIYDGGTRAALLGQARARADSAGIALTRRQDDAVRQIVLSDNALRTSVSAYAAASSLVAAAQTSFDAALAAYRNGVGSITAVTLAETALAQARQARADGYSAALTAAVTLAFATGTLGSPPN